MVHHQQNYRLAVCCVTFLWEEQSIRYTQTCLLQSYCSPGVISLSNFLSLIPLLSILLNFCLIPSATHQVLSPMLVPLSLILLISVDFFTSAADLSARPSGITLTFGPSRPFQDSAHRHHLKHLLEAGNLCKSASVTARASQE